MVRGALWGALVGAGIGVLGRTIMRAVAIAGGLEPTWSAGFSLHLVIIVMTVNAAVGMSYATIRDVLPGGRRRGLVGGALTLAIAFYPALLGELHAVIAEVGLPAAVGGVTGISSLFLLDGVLLEAALRPRAGADEPVPEGPPSVAAAALPGLPPAADAPAVHAPMAGAPAADAGADAPGVAPRS